jgi:hypothetical protein
MKQILIHCAQWAIRRAFALSSYAWLGLRNKARELDDTPGITAAERHARLDAWLAARLALPESVRQRVIQAVVLCLRLESLYRH